MDNNHNSWLVQFSMDNFALLPEEKELAKGKYKEVKSLLEGETFLSGSLGRHTAGTPLNDMDIIWVLDQKSDIYLSSISQGEIDIDKVIDQLEELLKDQYKGTSVKVEKGEHSVGIYFSGDRDSFSADVVPAIPQLDGKYKIPEVGLMSVKKRRHLYEVHGLSDITWILSHPKAYIEECTRLDNSTNGNFRHAVRFVKTWKRACKDENKKFALKSFHLECVIAEIFKKGLANDCFEALDYFFQNLEAEYLSTPCILDKAGGRYIDQYMETDFDKELVIKYLNEAKAKYISFKNTETKEEAEKFLQDILQPKESPPSSSNKSSQRSYSPYSKPYFAG